MSIQTLDQVVDGAAFVAVALLLCAVALLACWLPARKAMKIHQVTALTCA